MKRRLVSDIERAVLMGVLAFITALTITLSFRSIIRGIVTSADTASASPEVDVLDRVPSPSTIEDEIFALLPKSGMKYSIDTGFLTFCAENPNINTDGMFLQMALTRLETNGYDDSMWEDLTGYTFSVLYDIYTGAAEEQDNIHVVGELYYPRKITFAFAGDVNLSDGWFIMDAFRGHNYDINACFSPDLLDTMRAADIFLINNEYSISNRGARLPGKMYTFRASPANVSILGEIGVDIVSLANNHVYDYGPDAFDDTLAAFRDAGIPYVGAGVNIEEAKKPQYYIAGGMKYAIVAASCAEKNIFTPAATSSSGGIMYTYDPTDFLDVIREAAAVSDYVIAYVHWGDENTNRVNDMQRQLARAYIDAGADIVIGAHPHTLQPFEYYNDKLIVYSLGNYWFNTHETDTILLTVSKSVGIKETVKIHAAEQRDGGVYTSDEASLRIISYIKSMSPGVSISRDGVVTKEK